MKVIASNKHDHRGRQQKLHPRLRPTRRGSTQPTRRLKLKLAKPVPVGLGLRVASRLSLVLHI